MARGGMSLRYSQGVGRRGEREEQLELRARFVEQIRDALQRVEGGWQSLPRSLESWKALRPAAESPAS